MGADLFKPMPKRPTEHFETATAIFLFAMVAAAIVLIAIPANAEFALKARAGETPSTSSSTDSRITSVAQFGVRYIFP